MTFRQKICVGIVFGGRSGEHEVSLMSARSILDAIDRDKYTVIPIGISHDGSWLVDGDVLSALSQGAAEELMPAVLLPDPSRNGLYALRLNDSCEMLDYLAKLNVVFPVLHGTFGEDGSIQGLFELADVAYVGAGVLGSALAMDKGVCKEVLRANGLPVVDWIISSRSEIENDINAVVERAGQIADFPLFVKPANLGSSVGITKCTSRSDLMEGLLEAARYDRRILIERGVRNPRELEISVLGNEQPRVSVPGEIIPSRDFYSYEAKYLDDKSELIIPAPISPELTRQMQEMALRAYKAIDCAGMARVDFLLEDTGELFLSELNTIPGFTKISMYPKLWEASGIPYSALIDRLIDLAIRRKQDKDRTERHYRRNA